MGATKFIQNLQYEKVINNSVSQKKSQCLSMAKPIERTHYVYKSMLLHEFHKTTNINVISITNITCGTSNNYFIRATFKLLDDDDDKQ